MGCRAKCAVAHNLMNGSFLNISGAMTVARSGEKGQRRAVPALRGRCALFALSLSGAFKVLPHCKHPVGLDYVIAAVGKPAPAEVGVYSQRGIVGMACGKLNLVVIDYCVCPHELSGTMQLFNEIRRAYIVFFAVEYDLRADIVYVAAHKLLMYAVVVLEDRQILNFRRVLLDNVEKLRLGGGLDDYLVFHAVGADSVGDLAGVLPEFIHVYVATTLEAVKHFVEGAETELRVVAVVVYIAQAAYFLVGKLGKAYLALCAEVVEVSVFHLGMQYPQCAVGALVYVDLDHVRAVRYRDTVRGKGVAGNVSAAGAAMSDDYYPLGGVFFNVECHFFILSYFI